MEDVASEYDVVHALEGDHFKGHAFLAVIVNIAKSNLKRDAPKGLSLPARDYAMDHGAGPPLVVLHQVHLVQCIQVHDVDATSTVHHAFGELVAVNQGVDDHGVLVLHRDEVSVILPVPSDWNLRPAQVLGN